MTAKRNRRHIYQAEHIGALVADKVTAGVGSWAFVFAHMLWFSVWIGLHVEPFPYGLLTMIVSLEAIFLSTLVMMSQNRQGERDQKRDDHEAAEVDELFSTHQLLMQVNRQQLEILERMDKLDDDGEKEEQ